MRDLLEWADQHAHQQTLPWCAWKWKHWQVEGLVLMVLYRAAMIWTLPPVPRGLGWHSGNVRKKLGWWMGGEQGLETTMGVSRGWWSEALSPIPGTPAAAFSSSPWFILSPSPFILCMKTRVTLWSHLCITSSLLYTFGLCSTALRTKLRVLTYHGLHDPACTAPFCCLSSLFLGGSQSQLAFFSLSQD